MLCKIHSLIVFKTVGFLLIFFIKVHAVEETTEKTTDDDIIIGKVFGRAKNCFPLEVTLEPRTGPPSALFKGTCSCSQFGDPDVCPQWSYEGYNPNILLEQNVTKTSDHCVTNAYLKVNLTSSYLETIPLKCKLVGFRGRRDNIKVQKAGNRQPCFEDDDCRYSQQRCLSDYHTESKLCRCPYANDLFDPTRTDVCVQFIITESSAEQPGLISVVMIVIIAVLVAGIVLLGFRMMPTTRCCPGFITGHNMDRMSNNTVPFRPMEHPTQTQEFHQERVDSPPAYNTLVFANPPAYSESQKDSPVQNPGNSAIENK